MLFSMRKMRGVNLDHAKRSRLIETVDIPAPEYVVVPMRQHIGAPCEPCVKPGDHVYVGQKIGDSPAFVSAPIHSGISGYVEEICEILSPQNEKLKCVKIRSDGKAEPSPDIVPPEISSPGDFVRAVRESGTVGLGGAGFPTHVKLAYKDIARVETLYVNLAECEPYITADNREAIENADGVIDGINLVLKWTGIPKAVVVAEKNKPLAVKALCRAAEKFENISVRVIGSKYPKGAEKVLVFEAGGPVIGRGKLPADCGAIVMNISSAAAVASYIKTGMPLVSRRVTVDGDIVPSPKNLRVPIGTPVKTVLAFCEVPQDKLKMLISGGTMMGQCVIDLNTPVTKTTNALLCFEKFYDRDKTACIHCGRCIRVCPMKLSPALIERAYDQRNIEALKKSDVDLCMNCGCCSYACPAKRDLSHKNQLAKAFLKAYQKGGI
ncbi:MAG: RnfABCDGE type electron transport complex subunit C [Clostridiales bacterium]|nr:RnfABCDGE type electron transport complex subunit C [Clostridiales bacterium]